MQDEVEEVSCEAASNWTPFSKRLRLPYLVLWGLSPAVALTLAGLGLEYNMPWLVDITSFAGVFVGPVALLAWSLRVLWTTELKIVDKVVLSIPMTMGACAVNAGLAFGACSLFDPPL